MNTRSFVWIGVGILAVGAAGFGGWLVSRPAATAATDAPPIPQQEADATLAALKPPKRQRPVIAVVGINDATETTDYIMPTGILRRADVADVFMLATAPGRVSLYPALTVEPDATTAEFDERNPEGADYVIVPAMSRDDDPAALQWIRNQSAKGAMIIGVCYGVKVVAEAGLLDNKRGTTHWFALKELRKKHPSIQYVPNRRLVVDGNVATTTGITASIPMSLTLIEAIAGRDKAVAVAQQIGLSDWDARHASDAFKFTRPFAATVMGNTLAFWNRDVLGIELAPDLDEVSLALAADAWSRTYRSHAVTLGTSPDPIRTRNGIRLVPDEVARNSTADRVAGFGDRAPAQALEQTLSNIAARYGARTRYVVAMQLEYPHL